MAQFWSFLQEIRPNKHCFGVPLIPTSSRKVLRSEYYRTSEVIFRKFVKCVVELTLVMVHTFRKGIWVGQVYSPVLLY